MREINSLIIHGADTYPDMDIGKAEIDSWHRDRGWSSIGYHYVIRRSGDLEEGRPIDEIGAHTLGHNAESIGICLVGGKARETGLPVNYTAAQWNALLDLVALLVHRYPIKNIYGHNELTDQKTCPGFEVRGWNDFFLGDKANG